MKTTSLLVGSLTALVFTAVACGSSSDSDSNHDVGSKTDGGQQSGSDGGSGGPNADGGSTTGDDGGTQGGKDGGDSGTAVSGTSLTPPVAGADNFGSSVWISADGSTLAVGAQNESSGATGIGGDQKDTSKSVSGAVFVYAATTTGFALQAYVKASNTGAGAHFGNAVALSADGNTMIVGAQGERSNATGINGNQADASLSNAGAAYVFTRTGTTWSQQAYIKASNTRDSAQFGSSVALSGDGTTAVVGSLGESSNATSIGGNQNDTSANSSGAAYVFARSGSTWSQQEYVKASNGNSNFFFGSSAALSTDGNTMVIGAPGEASNATGIGGNQSDTSLGNAGAVYAFTRTGATWTQQAYVKPSNTKDSERFGNALSLAGDGNTLVVGSYGENSNSTAINGGNPADTSDFNAGAAFVFTRSGATWAQQAYLKCSDTGADQQLGWSTAISTSGDTILLGAPGYSKQVGAGYTFTRAAGAWTQKPRLGSILPPTGQNERFGYAVSVSSSPAKSVVSLFGIQTIETF